MLSKYTLPYPHYRNLNSYTLEFVPPLDGIIITNMEITAHKTIIYKT